jgi:simple sugar transport system ATP-binding protein
MELSDRIAVMYRGRLVATVDAADAEKERIGLIMATGEAGAAEAEGKA